MSHFQDASHTFLLAEDRSSTLELLRIYLSKLKHIPSLHHLILPRPFPLTSSTNELNRVDASGGGRFVEFGCFAYAMVSRFFKLCNIYGDIAASNRSVSHALLWHLTQLEQHVWTAFSGTIIRYTINTSVRQRSILHRASTWPQITRDSKYSLTQSEQLRVKQCVHRITASCPQFQSGN